MSAPDLEVLASVLDRLSDLANLRQIPRKASAAVKREWGYKCAICKGMKGTDGIIQIDAAHIRPAEEGGRPVETNLLALCRRAGSDIIQTEGNTDLVGCHQLYDNEGVWSRDEIRRVKKAGPGAALRLSRPTRKSLSTKDKIELLIQKRWTRRADEHAKRWAAETQDAPIDNVEALLTRLRIQRRRRGQERRQAFEDVLAGLRKRYRQMVLDPASSDGAERVEYEIGMLYFGIPDFERAARWLRLYHSRQVRGERGGFLINEAQACVADLERLGRAGGPTDIAIGQLEAVINELDKRSGDSFLESWRATARLHLARMKACSGDAQALDLVQVAKATRDGQNQETGWKSYSVFLLLQAEGECYRAAERYDEAIPLLALAGRKILREEYKQFEYLDDVLGGLLAIPEKKSTPLDDSRSVLRQSLDALAAARIDATRWLVDALGRLVRDA